VSPSGTRTDTRTVDRPGRRVLADDPAETAPGFFTSAIDGAPRWVAGVLSAAQAAVLSLLTLVLPAVAAYVATSADPSNEGVGWLRSVRVAAALWLLGHGVPATVGGVVVGLTPLGVTALALFACYASARRSGLASRSGFAAGVVTYVVIALLVGLLTGPSPERLLRAVVGGAAVAVLGLGAGLLRRPEAPSLRDLTRPLWSRCTPYLRVGAAAGTLACALVVVLAGVLTALWVLAGRATIGDVVHGLRLDAVGGVVLAVAELAFVPDLVVWAAAWLAGPGFAVGAGTHVTPADVLVGPLPAVPMLGALPAPDTAGGVARLLPVVVVAVGAVLGWYVHRRLPLGRWWHGAAACAIGALATAAGVGALALAASGSAGPGRMAVVGPTAWLVALVVGGEVLVGALLVALPADPLVRERVGVAVRESWRQVRPGTSTGLGTALGSRDDEDAGGAVDGRVARTDGERPDDDGPEASG